MGYPSSRKKSVTLRSARLIMVRKVTPIQLFVIRNHNLSKRFVSTQNHVATVLAFQVEADFAQRSGAAST